MRFSVIVVSLCVLVLSTSVAAQELGGGTGLKDNLDLPWNIERTGVVFYGTRYEGEAFFYAVDRSGSMQDRGELERAKQEIVHNITELPPDTEFGVSFFDSGLIRFPASGVPAKADAAMKEAALGWIVGVRGGSGSCLRLGLQSALNFANLSKARRKVIIYVGDGGGTCHGANENQYLQETVSIITSQNYQSARIDSVGVLMEGRASQKQHMVRLSESNGGSYKEFVLLGPLPPAPPPGAGCPVH